jgi:predicted class III extradiol MEMO1 family dioxygenase
MSELSQELADSIATIMKRNDWKLGRDLAIVVSSDAVHYGPDFDHAPFGTGPDAYERAVQRDRRLASRFLEGPLSSTKLQGLLETLIDPDDLEYRLPWCGRFSVPFGLEVLRKVAMDTQGVVPRGRLLRYGTSLSEPELPISDDLRKNGLGYTAPSNFHHWVGYASVGYVLPAR